MTFKMYLVDTPRLWLFFSGSFIAMSSARKEAGAKGGGPASLERFHAPAFCFLSFRHISKPPPENSYSVVVPKSGWGGSRSLGLRSDRITMTRQHEFPPNKSRFLGQLLKSSVHSGSSCEVDCPNGHFSLTELPPVAAPTP